MDKAKCTAEKAKKRSNSRGSKLSLKRNQFLMTNLYLFVLVTGTIFLSTVVTINDGAHYYYVNETERPTAMYVPQIRGKKIKTPLKSNQSKVSVVVLTYKKYEKLEKVIRSVLQQKDCEYEILVADNGCFDETKKVVDNLLDNKRDTVPYKYLPLCDNPGYAVGNNNAVRSASSDSNYVLLLNDDLVLSEPDFIYNLVHLAQMKENAAAVGCKILNAEGSELIEAGSIVWEEGNAAGFGRGRKDFNAPEFSYAKPVDYISGACLLVEKEIFQNLGGFDQKLFPNYYEDTDLQMHIQHDLHKEVWLQPKAVGLHDEHGSFGNDESKKLMQAARQTFVSKWNYALKGNHIRNPSTRNRRDQAKAFFQAADLNARNPHRANILYFEDKAPNKSQGSGFGRSFDNLSMITSLGHRVTMVTLGEENKEWCDDQCVDEITGLGVEYVASSKSRDALFRSRVGYYDIVVVSRPTTLFLKYNILQDFYRKSPFALVYDCEALWYRRNEMLIEHTKKKKIPFPGYGDMTAETLDRSKELALTKMADTVITVSQGEKDTIDKLVHDVDDVKIVGHVMDSARMTKKSFKERNGIFFLASFSNSMYYNGDAIWYFLTEIYPLVIKETRSSNPIPLTIAGRGIPDKLRAVVNQNKEIASYVTFSESPVTVDDLYEVHRLFIAPHLYGAGIQYKVSESVSLGLPVVMSTFTKESFGDIPGCVGSDPRSFMECIVDLHSNERQWEAVRKKGISWIEETHSLEEATKQWSKIIDTNFARVLKKDDHKLLLTKELDPVFPSDCTWQCYLQLNPDVGRKVKDKKGAIDHYLKFGVWEFRRCACDEEDS